MSKITNLIENITNLEYNTVDTLLSYHKLIVEYLVNKEFEKAQLKILFNNGISISTGNFHIKVIKNPFSNREMYPFIFFVTVRNDSNYTHGSLVHHDYELKEYEESVTILKVEAVNVLEKELKNEEYDIFPKNPLWE